MFLESVVFGGPFSISIELKGSVDMLSMAIDIGKFNQAFC